MIRETIIRPARREDAEAIGRIYVESWRATYRGILPQTYLSGLQAAHAARSIRHTLMDPRTLCLMVDSEQGGVGYISAGPERGQDQIYDAELYELYLLPAVQRQGLGRQLLAQMARRLHRQRFYTLLVWVLTRNPNRRFYEKCNGIYLRTRSITFAGQALLADAYGWIDITLAM
jgi:GNAT superfamily N-acetyltransferase